MIWGMVYDCCDNIKLDPYVIQWDIHKDIMW